MGFSQQLKALLAKRGMSQVDLAKRLGVTHSAVTMMLNDKMRLPPARLDEVFRILRVPQKQRPALRASYLASVAPKPVRREGAEMLQAYELLLERAEAGDAMLEADHAFDRLPPSTAMAARKGYYGPIIDTLTTLGAFDKKSHAQLRARLDSAHSPADIYWLVAKIAIGLVRLRPDATRTELFGKLRGILSGERVAQILANVKGASSR